MFQMKFDKRTQKFRLKRKHQPGRKMKPKVLKISIMDPIHSLKEVAADENLFNNFIQSMSDYIRFHPDFSQSVDLGRRIIEVSRFLCNLEEDTNEAYQEHREALLISQEMNRLPDIPPSSSPDHVELDGDLEHVGGAGAETSTDNNSNNSSTSSDQSLSSGFTKSTEKSDCSTGNENECSYRVEPEMLEENANSTSQSSSEAETTPPSIGLEYRSDHDSGEAYTSDSLLTSSKGSLLSKLSDGHGIPSTPEALADRVDNVFATRLIFIKTDRRFQLALQYLISVGVASSILDEWRISVNRRKGGGLLKRKFGSKIQD